jgi:hypothetical protein
MAELTVAFSLPGFRTSFAWRGDASAALALIGSVKRATRRRGWSLRDYLEIAVCDVRKALAPSASVAMQEAARLAIIAYALRMPIGLPEWPGRVFNYLEAGDFLVEFTQAGPEHITCSVGIDRRAGTVGSA